MHCARLLYSGHLIFQPFEVISDASLLGTGAVLMQDDHPIAYTSSKFIPAEINYTIGDQELLAVLKLSRFGELLP